MIHCDLRVNFGFFGFRIRLSFRISYSFISCFQVQKYRRKEEEFLAKSEEMEKKFELKEGKWACEREKLKQMYTYYVFRGLRLFTDYKLRTKHFILLIVRTIFK
jgi:hypothetical protein